MHVIEGKYKRVCDEARLRALETTAPFEDMARWLEADMEIVCCHTFDCCDKPGSKCRITPRQRGWREMANGFINSNVI